MIIIGIDNGYSGGLAFYDTKTLQITYYVMPIVVETIKKKKHRSYDMVKIIELIKIHNPKLAILERANAMPGQGVTSMFNFGVSYGIMQGILTSLNINYKITQPKAWQKYIFEGIVDTGDTKQNAYIYCKRKFPEHNFLATSRSKKPHSGICDAVGMACFGITQL